jgi:hypothetical protein
MTLRITDTSQIGGLSSRFRAQIEDHGHDIGGLSSAHRSHRPRYREEEAGRQIVRWVDTLVVEHGARGRIKVADFFVHIPNGGARNAKEAAILQGQGVRAGWPDYQLNLPRGGFFGLLAELKHEDGQKPDADQLAILRRHELMGYRCMIWFGFADAEKQLLGYLQLPPTTVAAP